MTARRTEIRIAVLGLGHVGLPTALGFAKLGLPVIGADSDSEKIDRIRRGICPFFEPGLETMLAQHIQDPNFRVTDDVEAAIRAADVLFICVGTPQAESGEADLSQVEELARLVALNLNGYKLIVEKSTVPAITGKWIRRTVERYSRRVQRQAIADSASLGVPAKRRNGNGNGSDKHAKNTVVEFASAHFDVASNPEFLQEGKAVENITRPDRIVCGVESETAHAMLSRVYAPFRCPIVFTDLTTAELIKHTANAFLATKISFINMISDLCDALGADVEMVSRGIGLDPRISGSFLHSGIGFGGYCLPKDLRALIHLSEQRGVEVPLLHAAERVNLTRVDRVVAKLRDALWMLPGKTIAIFGLAFKADTDDVREAPALRIIRALQRQGAMLRLYDPQAMPSMKVFLPEEPGRLVYCASAYEAATDAHAALILTEWDEFRALDLGTLKSVMQLPVLIDGRNLLDPAAARSAGFEYAAMGRGGTFTMASSASTANMPAAETEPPSPPIAAISGSC